MREFAGGVVAGVAVAAMAAYVAWPAAAPTHLPFAAIPGGVPLAVSPSLLAVPANSGPAAADRLPPVLASSSAGGAFPPKLAASVVGQGAIGALPAAPSITLSAEHASVLVGKRRPPTLQEQHADFVTQSKDPVNSARLEDEIRQAVAAANATAEFELLSVDCRTGLCEVLAFGNLPTSGERWSETFTAMSKAPWYAESIRNESTSTVSNNNRYTIVTILQRKK